MNDYNMILPKYGDLMTIEKFKENCQNGGFIDYDGFGYPVKDNLHTGVPIYPSQINRIPKDATHFVWFNR